MGAHVAGRTYALVLAAGRGRRFGSNKLLASCSGRPLLSHVLDVVAEGCKRRVFDGGQVVIAPGQVEAETLCRKASLRVILNDAPGRGLSHSLRLGLKRVERLHPGGDAAALVFLGDQPLVQLPVVEQVIAAHRATRAAVVRPRYASRPEVPGHPVLLDRSIWRLARNLEGDRGLLDMLAAPSIEMVTVDVSGDNPDIDTLADLQALEEASS